jgi:hypothetical protein
MQNSHHHLKLKLALDAVEKLINPDQTDKTYGFVLSLVPLNQPDLRQLTSFLGTNIPNPVTELVLQQSLKVVRSIDTPHDVPENEIPAS